VEASFATFGELARGVASAARASSLEVPTFRTPPRTAGVDRTLRRRRDGSAEVAVRLAGRSEAAVLADLVEGVVLANGLTGEAARDTRRRLLTQVRFTAARAG
jgi:hypothetical protein